jgi:hypothetical protein
MLLEYAIHVMGNRAKSGLVRCVSFAVVLLI